MTPPPKTSGQMTAEYIIAHYPELVDELLNLLTDEFDTLEHARKLFLARNQPLAENKVSGASDEEETLEHARKLFGVRN